MCSDVLEDGWSFAILESSFRTRDKTSGREMVSSRSHPTIGTMFAFALCEVSREKE